MTSVCISSVGAEVTAALYALCRGPLVLFLGACLTACGTVTDWSFDARNVPPLQLDGEIYSYDPQAEGRRDPGVLYLTDEMRAFVAQHTQGSNGAQSKLRALHAAVKGPGLLGIRYDAFVDGTARDVFRRGTANCLSYAHLFVALAREAGINARYNWVDVRPKWHRMGDRVAVQLHINVLVKMPNGQEYLVDIDPLRRWELAGARAISDEEGLALFYNNLAMNALAEDRPAEAWMHLVRGLEVAPKLSELWVNLGAIYRYADQLAEAEQAYFYALKVDHGARSAMNNLVVLYELQGRTEERDYWEARLVRYRDQNPYYHASLGDAAMRKQNWDLAYEHYDRARRLQPRDGQLVYDLGLAAHRRGDDREATRLINRAIEKAAFEVDRQRYKSQLRSIREQEAAAL